VKTHTIEWTNIESRSDARKYDPARKLNRFLCLSANLFLALVPALAVITGAAWLITAPDLAAYLQAFLWGAGFVFLGVAVDAPKPLSMLSLVTGLTLSALAMFSSQVAVEIAVVAVAILAAWTAVAIWRHASVQQTA
jgi:hypothetical protein